MDYQKIQKLNKKNLYRETSEQLLSISQNIQSIINYRDPNLNSQFKLQLHELNQLIKKQNHYLYDDNTTIFN